MRQGGGRVRSDRYRWIISFNFRYGEPVSGKRGKQLLDNVQWRQDCAAKVGLGFTLPTLEEQPLMDKSGQVVEAEGQEEVAA